MAILAYLAVRSSASDPLFLHADGTPLTWPELISAVCLALTTTGMDLSRYTGHSFWIGAATSAALASLPDSFIQALGHWSSSSFLRYIRTPTHTLLRVSQQLARTTSTQQLSS